MNKEHEKKILEVYKEEKDNRNKVLSFLSSNWIKTSTWYWNIYVDLENYLQEKDNGLKYDSSKGVGISFLWNINGKTASLLYYKTKEIKETIEKALIDLGKIFDKQDKQLQYYREFYWEKIWDIPYAELYHKA